MKQMKRQQAEVREKHLDARQLAGFSKAKAKEVKNFVVAEAFKALPNHLKPSRDQVLKMRWLLTWKLDEDPEEGVEPLNRDASGNPLRPKARAVVLGYMDPMYEHRPTSSPTMNRSTRQLFLQMCANHKFQIEKGDISGAFLQGEDFGEDRPMFCEPLPEILDAIGAPRGSTMLLTKAAYGLVEAPLQWYLSMAKFIEGLGGERQFSDPCAWGFFDEARNPVGYIVGHVDDLLFGGRANCSRWSEIKKKLKERFKWGSWEASKFTQCGVLIETLEDNSFQLSQPEYLDGVDEIHVTRSRWNQTEAAVTPFEQQQLRSVLGALSWHSNQVAPYLSAPVSLLLSKIPEGTVQTILEVNKLLKKAKVNKHQKLRIHAQSPDERPLISMWVDAAHANRVDGSSTKGMLAGWCSQRLMHGHLETVSPLYWQSARLQRVCRSSAASETRAAVDAEDELYALRFQAFEYTGGQVSLWKCDDAVQNIDGVIISDSKNLYDRLCQTVLTLKGAERRTDIETLCLKESMTSASTQIRWVNGDSQLANSLTKESEPHQLAEFMRRQGRWRIVYDPSLLSGRKRKQLGLQSLDVQKQSESEKPGISISRGAVQIPQSVGAGKHETSTAAPLPQS